MGPLVVDIATGNAEGLKAAAAAADAARESDMGLSEVEAARAICAAGAFKFKDEKWATYSAPLGWAVRGVYTVTRLPSRLFPPQAC